MRVIQGGAYVQFYKDSVKKRMDINIDGDRIIIDYLQYVECNVS